ncbi:hypothetical protein D6C91_07229 [Aureobasidium pullulans]|uniref:Uncharacterized protein n=1 Tax=Aureobasidium pullulans TaxID=5580 RepID=A0A4S9STK5_AURPU|nr:hypothetical protein D6C91_07229 [Aureobasidium pullulans]
MSLVFTSHESIARTTLPRLLNLSASTTFRFARSFSHPQISTMSLPSPVPIALCGKSQTMATNFSDSMSKEGYEVVHTCHDLDSAKSTLPSLLTSSTGPLAVVIGKGFYESEMQDIIKHCQSEAGGTKTVWLLPDDDKFTAYMKVKAVASAGTMLPGMIAERAAAALKENGVVGGGSTEGVKSGVHGF